MVPPVTSPRAKTTIPGEVHHPGQGVSVDSVLYGPFDYQAFTVSEDLRKEAIGLPR